MRIAGAPAQPFVRPAASGMARVRVPSLWGTLSACAVAVALFGAGVSSARAAGPVAGGAPALAPLATPVETTADARQAAADAIATPVPTTGDAPDMTPNGRRIVMSFKQLGALYPLQLRGVSGQDGVPFSVRADEVVTSAKLHLRYSYSPALLPELSHIKVLVNGEVAATIPVPKAQAGMLVTREVPIEPRLITDFNHLGLSLVGHYTTQCEDPANSSLWANVSNLSTIELIVTPIPEPDDLAQLPLPFFDPRDVRRLSLPFVIGTQPGTQVLEAAGVVSSWFGALAGYRGARFPVLTNKLPPYGNAVVFATADSKPDGVSLPSIDGPTVAIAAQPNDPHAKLLLVLGRDARELKTAAAALALGQASLSGPLATISQLREVRPRVPYDAPNWVPSERKVRFGELANPRDLEVQGYNPDLVRVNLRLPPDLFMWHSNGAPIDLIWRYTARPSTDKSTLNVNVNSNFVQSLRIPAASADLPGWAFVRSVFGKARPGGTAVAENRLYIPPLLLQSTAQLQFHYFYDQVKHGACGEVPPDNVRGAIDPNSTIDVSSFPHYMALPDLAAFANSGFPFTRMADLSETAVVLPDNASADDLSTYLAVMGRMGESTGYPVTGVTVTRAADVVSADSGAGSVPVADKDLIVLGSPANQPLLSRWAKSMPYSVSGDGSSFGLSDLAFKVVDWWHGDRGLVDMPTRASLTVSGLADKALVMGFESPLKADRSVLALVASEPRNQADLLSALLDPHLVKQLQGGMAVVHGRTVTAVATGERYYVGRLPPYEYVRWVLSAHPLVLALSALVAALMAAVLMYRVLHAIAARRLKR